MWCQTHPPLPRCPRGARQGQRQHLGDVSGGSRSANNTGAHPTATAEGSSSRSCLPERSCSWWRPSAGPRASCMATRLRIPGVWCFSLVGSGGRPSSRGLRLFAGDQIVKDHPVDSLTGAAPGVPTPTASPEHPRSHRSEGTPETVHLTATARPSPQTGRPRPPRTRCDGNRSIELANESECHGGLRLAGHQPFIRAGLERFGYANSTS